MCSSMNHDIGRDADVFSNKAASIQNNLDVGGERRAFADVKAFMPISPRTSKLDSTKHCYFWFNVKSRQAIKHRPYTG